MAIVAKCSKCLIEFREGDSIRWCPYEACPKTSQHLPSPAEAKALRYGEPFDPHGSDRKCS